MIYKIICSFHAAILGATKRKLRSKTAKAIEFYISENINVRGQPGRTDHGEKMIWIVQIASANNPPCSCGTQREAVFTFIGSPQVKEAVVIRGLKTSQEIKI